MSKDVLNNVNDTFKKKVLLAILLLLILIVGVVIYFLKINPSNNIDSTQKDTHYNYILANKKGPIVGCLFGEKEEEYSCYKTADKKFVSTNFLGDLPNDMAVPAGLHLFILENGVWKPYLVNKEEIYDKWYKEILANEKQFLVEVDSKIDVDLYNLIKLRRIQISKGDFTEEELINNLSEYSQPPYRILTPMRYSDLTYVCNIIPSESCSLWEKYKSIPFNMVSSTNEDPDFDYEDIGNLWSRIKFLNMGYNSIDLLDDKNESKVLEYDKFLNKVISNNPQFSREKISFISDYLPLNFLDFVDPIFDFWNGEFFNNYIWILDATCQSGEYLDIKLNILYDEHLN